MVKVDKPDIYVETVDDKGVKRLVVDYGPDKFTTTWLDSDISGRRNARKLLMEYMISTILGFTELDLMKAQMNG